MTTATATLRPMAKREGTRRPAKPADEAGEWIMVGARVSRPVAHALKLAATKRQIEGKAPNSQQAIIEEAIREWLKRNGHL